MIPEETPAMLKIGCHLSCAKGFLAMGKAATSIGANTFQFFTRNPRGASAKKLDERDVEQYRVWALEHHFAPALAHAAYTMNASAATEHLRALVRETMADDLARLESIPGSLYNFHPGNHVNQGVEAGIEWVAAALNEILKPEQATTVLLETMSGKGSEIGREFEELREIRDRVGHRHLLGVCLETCHVGDAGYDLAGDLDGVLEHFDRAIGLEHLHAIHLNDSQNPRGSRKDRHATIGEGHIGLDALARIINHPVLRHLPFYLETPNDLAGHAREIAMLRKLYRDDV